MSQKRQRQMAGKVRVPGPAEQGNVGDSVAFVPVASEKAETPPSLAQPDKALFWLLGLALICLLPFIAKPFHIDDPLFVWAAEHIRQHPGDFFGFQINWYHTFEPMHEVFQNPPLVCYYIAACAACFGWNEVALHVAFLLPALAAVWGIYSLAKLYCTRPAFVVVAALLTPVFLISATSVMCDVTLLAFWVWTIRVFERGLRSESSKWFVLAGLLAALAYLTKFSGLALVPLLVAWGLLRQKRLGWWLLTPLLTLMAVGAYEILTRHLYGHGHLFQASGYAIEQGTKPRLTDKLVVGIGFAGGCFLPLHFYAPLMWSRRVLYVGAVVFGVALLALPFEPALAPVLRPKGNLDWLATLQSALLVTAGIYLLGFVVGCAKTSRQANCPNGEMGFDVASILLLLWVLGVFTFAIGVNWVINGRSFLPALPPLAILAMRAIERRGHADAPGGGKGCPHPDGSFDLRRLWKRIAFALPAAAVSLWLAWADYAVARSQRVAAQELMAKYSKDLSKAGGPTGSVWFEGHWGWQYYMQKLGAKPLDMVHPQIQAGDLVIIPNCSYGVSRPDPKIARLLDTAEYLPNRYLSTLNPPAGACFYAVTWGPFPFVMKQLKPDLYLIFRHSPIL